MKKLLWEDFGELLKIETTITSMLYVVLGFIVSAVSSQNQILFELYEGRKFIPYLPLMKGIITFTVGNIVWILLGFIGALSHGAELKKLKFIAYANISIFLVCLAYFAYVIESLVSVFGF